MMTFTKNLKFCFKKKSFYSILFNFLSYYCSIDLKRQSEQSGLHPDRSSLVVFEIQFKCPFLICEAKEADFSV